MINLIPKEEKKEKVIDFYFRLVILFIAMLDFCILVAFFSLLPSYFISSVKHSLTSARLENQKLEPLPLQGEDSLVLLKDINNKITLVEKFEKNKFPLSVKVINAILLNKRPDIKITEISYENNGTSEKKISITGVAPSREVLLLFREALENSSSFKNVNLPISNFVKGSNINFNLSLTPS
ncbi:MAG: hypothetical protein PHT16_00970 [Candidatus Pacebacteria bacterium]|nr:hypothetical protein [Candidatus Paceibacterota bacterium]